MKSQITECISPNPGYVSMSASWVMGGFWIGLMFFYWSLGSAVYLPTPLETIRAFPTLWFTEGIGQQLWISFITNMEAAAIMAAVSFFIAVATVMPLFRPLATFISSGRFNGFVGLPLVFMSIFHNPYKVKVALLVFGMGVFTVLSLVKMIESIPKEQFDHCRTLRYTPWRVVWEVIIFGKFDEVIDILRINIAMGWMMLPMVEGNFRMLGGVGAVMLNEQKHLNLDMVFCALGLILIVGLIQDATIGKFKQLACPYASLGMER